MALRHDHPADPAVAPAPAPPSTRVRPGLGQHVRLRAVDGLDEIVRVVGVDGLTIALGCETPTAAQGQIVFSHPRGVVCLAGTLRRADGDRLELTVTEQRRLEQRRSFFRQAVAQPVRIARPDGETLAARTVDISLGGVRVRDSRGLELDEQVVATIWLDEFGEIEATGRVVRRDPDHEGHALAFDPLGRCNESRLSHFLADVQRRRLHGTAA
jgi:PilZ domain-containing protein